MHHGFKIYYTHVEYYLFASASTDTPNFMESTHEIYLISICLIFSKAAAAVDYHYSCFH